MRDSLSIAFVVTLASCAGACDVSKCESPDKISGRCSGECLGSCTTIATDLDDPDGGLPCKGRCVGEIDLPTRGDVEEVKVTEASVLNKVSPMLEISTKKQRKEA